MLKSLRSKNGKMLLILRILVDIPFTIKFFSGKGVKPWANVMEKTNEKIQIPSTGCGLQIMKR
jgi:hypothetical protein